MSSSLSLHIYGNKRSDSGFAPILVIGTPLAIADSFYPGFESCTEFYVLHTAESHTLYTVVRNGVSSIGAARTGSFKMALGVPRGMKFADGVSPYDVLTEAYRYYVAHYLAIGIAGAQFLDRDEQVDEFRTILSRYRLEPAHSPHRPTAGTGFAVVTADEATTRAIFADPAYREFQAYGEVVFAPNHASMAPRLNVATPRPKVYDIYLGNQRVGEINPAIKPSFTINVPATQSYEENTAYTIQIAKAMQGAEPGVKVDESEERIVCRLSPRLKTISLRIEAVLENGEAISPSRLVLRSQNGRSYPIPERGEVQLEGPDTELKWSIAPSDHTLKMLSHTATQLSNGGRLLRVTLRSTLKPVNSPSGHIRPTSGGGSQSSRLPALLLFAGIGLAVGLLLGVLIGFFIWGHSATPATAAEQEQVSKDRSATGADMKDIEQMYKDYKVRLGTINEPTDSLLSKVDEWLQTEPACAFDRAHKEADRLSLQYKEVLKAWQALKQGEVESLNKILQNKNSRLSDSQKIILKEFVRVNGKNADELKNKAAKAESFENLLPKDILDQLIETGAH